MRSRPALDFSLAKEQRFQGLRESILPLKFPPVPGQIVICDYATGFREPEMVKERLAVVISPRLAYRNFLATVVPLSLTPPRAGIRYQCKVDLPVSAPPPYEGQFKFAKADMLATVCYDRLSMPYTGRDPVTKRRKYLTIILAADQQAKIHTSILFSLGLDHLTEDR